MRDVGLTLAAAGATCADTVKITSDVVDQEVGIKDPWGSVGRKNQDRSASFQGKTAVKHYPQC